MLSDDDVAANADPVPIRVGPVEVSAGCLLGQQAAAGEITAAELGRLWPELVAVRPQKVVFTGGEPAPALGHR